ncbi:protein kinase [Rhodococcus sp. NPDC057135]|uniref:protein kinase domain-containing protein n=1 Tax=Rhodococcus sp. NPDC057135 TaxID=3346028 RepID=UPI0036382418
MTDNDPLRTQRDVAAAVAEMLRAAGFYDAEEIGRGGFGVVYRCTQTALERTVAVKVLIAELDEENRERFFREQRAMGRLTGHPNIAAVLQVGITDDGRPYLVMPYYGQGSLDTRIRLHGPITPEAVLRLGVKMSAAVATAHRAGILHRDMKPANILITDYGELVLTDFGIAHITYGFTTATGTVARSPAFTSPEALGGDPSSPAADVYGLGATLFAALTGHAAFERHSGEQVVAQFLRITTQSVPDLREHGIDGDLAAVIEHAMARNPEDRPEPVALGERLQQLQARGGFRVDEMVLRDYRDTAFSAEGTAAPVPLTTGVTPSPTGGAWGGGGCLPAELTTFVGRRAELAEVRGLMSQSRLVTLTGIGGVGKTRLALRAAANVRKAFAGRVWLVELGELHDGALLADVIATALGLRSQSTRSASHVLVDFLAPREALLVLDNCEQVIDAAARLSETLLSTCPGLRILATSREVLDIGGEVVVRVPPLMVPGWDGSLVHGLSRYDAVRLFADRGASALPGFEVTEDNAATIAGICARLEGIPLAVELAAGRLRALSPEQILQRLTDRYALLTLGIRGATPRQQTIRLCVDWSYELCTPNERHLWAQLSVFAGSVELDAIEQVYRYDGEVDDLIDVLTALVAKSILIREDSGSAVRFRMLETLRDYGRERAQRAGEFVDLQLRHSRWYRQMALDAEAAWIGARQLDWTARLDREQSNLREALDFALTNNTDTDSALTFVCALQPFWFSLGRFGEGRHWLDRALAAPPGVAPAVRAKALYLACLMAPIQGDLAVASARVAEARALAERSTDPVVHAYADFAEGQYEVFAGEVALPGERLQEAHAVFAAHGEMYAQVLVLVTLGWARTLQRDTARALDCIEEAITITESRGESVLRSHALWAAAVVSLDRGDRNRAQELLRQVLVLVRLRRDPFLAAQCLEDLAWIASAEGNVRRAAVLMGAAWALGQTTGTSSVPVPNLLAYHDECEQNVRHSLGRRSFAAAHREGIALDFDAAIAYALGEEPAIAQPTTGFSPELTNRERQVADLVSEGLTNKAIAARLVISPRTAAGHVEHILTKLGFTSRAQIAAWVIEQGRR